MIIRHLIRTVTMLSLLPFLANPAAALEVTSTASSGVAAVSTEALGAIEPKLLYLRAPAKRMLHYFIERSAFSPEEGEMIAANLAQAGRDWADACPECGIGFIEVADRTQAEFRVVAAPKWSPFMAKAFYPSTPKKDWLLSIDRSYFNQQSHYDKVGVMRHELGHVLGYRHEQSAADPKRQKSCGWQRDPPQVRLTSYDLNSVMHYPCSPVTGTVRFSFSPCDRAGHRRLYAPSAASQHDETTALQCQAAE